MKTTSKMKMTSKTPNPTKLHRCLKTTCIEPDYTRRLTYTALQYFFLQDWLVSYAYWIEIIVL